MTKPTDAEMIAKIDAYIDEANRTSDGENYMEFTTEVTIRDLVFIRDRLASLTPTNEQKIGAALIEAELGQVTAADNGYKAGWNAALDAATQQLGASVDIVTTLDKLRKL